MLNIIMDYRMIPQLSTLSIVLCLPIPYLHRLSSSCNAHSISYNYNVYYVALVTIIRAKCTIPGDVLARYQTMC